MNKTALAISALSGAMALTGQAAQNPNKPNVLFIAVDDMNCDLGTYGCKEVPTPNLDRLAKGGIVFQKAYCQQPLCAPSRYSIMTGLRPDTLGIYGIGKNILREKHPDIITLGQLFIKNGYYSGRVGKIYHYNNPSQIGTDGHDDAASWLERFNPAGIDKTRENEIIRYPGGTKAIPGKKQSLGARMSWWDPVSEDDDHTDGKVCKIGMEMIQKNKNKPFFVAVGFFNPHCPYVAPRKYFDLHPLNKITMQSLEEAKKDLEDVPRMALDTKWPYKHGATYEDARKCKRAYYATLSFLDVQVGRLLDALKVNGVLDNTIIVFWSDHGYFLGEKGLWFKRKAFERSVRVPLIISTPETRKMDKVRNCPAVVELLDLYPTLADLCHLKGTPRNLEGASLRPLLKNPNAKWDQPAITQVARKKRTKFGYSIRTPRWRYIEWDNGKEGYELYDHDKDPEEITNLAKDPKHTDIMKKLREQLLPYKKFKKK